jgi:hypothetical protein
MKDKPIDIRKVIRERGDIDKAVKHNISLYFKNRKLIMPNYKDGGK